MVRPFVIGLRNTLTPALSRREREQKALSRRETVG